MGIDNPGFKQCAKKQQIPTCAVLGVEIAVVDMPWLLDFTIQNLRELSGDYLCAANVHTTVTAWEDEHYRKVQNGGIMAIPDGAPLYYVGKMRGFKEIRRTTGPDYMERIFEISAQKGYRHFFYGSSEQTLEKMRKKLQQKYPELCIARMYSPPYREQTLEEKQADIDRINEANADFIWVGLGAPKQELWMAEHQGKVKGFMVGVGAAFDFFAENIKRAPKWMQVCCLEWLYRMIQDPGRLFMRYLHSNTRFIYHAVIRRK